MGHLEIYLFIILKGLEVLTDYNNRLQNFVGSWNMLIRGNLTPTSTDLICRVTVQDPHKSLDLIIEDCSLCQISLHANIYICSYYIITKLFLNPIMKEDNDVHYSCILHKCQVMENHAEVLKIWFSNIWMFGVLNNQSNITHL